MRNHPTARRALVAALGVALALTAAGGVTDAARATTNVVPGAACTGAGTGTVTCELWAKTGTLTLPAGASPATVPIRGYAATADGPATAPGPVLVVGAGDTVTLTLHNGLAEPTSLSLPQVDGFVDDGAGADPGGTKAYTFTASRPGTYLYQAGLTAGGPRQAALGLVGALLVRPAVAGTLDGTTGTAFDDEALLVLTEVDDRLNANPASFDMRSYAPRFRLVAGGSLSGVTGPGTATLATEPGHRLLVRVVNAGLVEHALGALGLRQDVVALGGRSLAHPYDVFAETVQPGQTLDTLVTVPADAAGATFPVYETAAGDGVSGSLANFSGMLAFVTVGGAGGATGPAVTGLAVTSSRTDAPAFPVHTGDTVTVTGAAGTGATGAEYAVDAQTGWQAAELSASGTVTVPAVAVTAAMATGQHTVFVRASDATTTGAVSAVTFAVDNTGPKVTGLVVSPTVSAGTTAIAISATGDDSATGGSNTASASYSLDGGAPQPLTLNRTAPVVALTGSVAAPVPAGAHTVAVTATDALGNSTATAATAAFTVDATGPVVSPGSVSVSPAANNGTQESRVGSGTFAVSATLTDDVAVGYGEGFFDTAGAPGTGFAMLANSNATGSPLTVRAEVPLSQLTALADGAHAVAVRGRDTAGNWGAPLVGAGALVVDRVAPVIGTPVLTPDPTRGAPTGALSVPVSNTGTAVGGGTWRLTTAAGVAAGTGALAGTVPANGPGGGASATLTGTVAYPAAAGTYTLTVSVTDGTGRVTSRTANVTVQANRVFANGFESATAPFGWTSRTGALTTTTTGAIAGSRSGTVALTASGSYVTDDTPVAETTFHAAFLARATGTTATTANATIYQAYGGNGGGGTALFRVLLRHSGGAVQVGIATPTGTPSTWAAVTTAAGQSTSVRVDLTGTTAALTVGGAATGSVTVPAGGVGSVRLGAVTGGANLGSLLVDGYDSARDRLPS